MPRFSRLYERTGFQGKTLWEWMELLVVPLVLAIGGFLFTYIQDRNNNQIAQDNQRQVALQTYFDRMSELMIDKGLRESVEGAESRIVARTLTLSVLGQLDEQRKEFVVRFLQESQLISETAPLVELNNADLTGAFLLGAFLLGANLNRTYLRGADLRGAFLEGADLSLARLRGADLSLARLSGATLMGADLEGADLTRAHLEGATLTDADLTRANLTGATMPDGTKHP